MQYRIIRALNIRFSEKAGVAVTFFSHILEVPVSNLRQTTTISFQIFPNPLFTSHPNARRGELYILRASMNTQLGSIHSSARIFHLCNYLTDIDETSHFRSIFTHLLSPYRIL
jgi:hypothetical protein